MIEKVHGIEIEEFVSFTFGGKMQMEMSKRKFEVAMKNVCEGDILSRALRMNSQEGYVELSTLIELLIAGGVKSRKVLATLRELGISEEIIADSFAVAVSSLAKK